LNNLSLKKVKTRNKVVLTGTPLQNNLMEYFTIVEFVQPGYWSLEEFKSFFIEPILNGMMINSTIGQVELMKKRSFILVDELKYLVDRKDSRILKKDLPEKFEFVIFLKLSDIQQKLYNSFLTFYEKSPS
jgi:SNF2 family DNA or RNA helicase